MDVFATRTLSYTDDTGITKDVVLTVSRPFEVAGDWKCIFAFDPVSLEWNLSLREWTFSTPSKAVCRSLSSCLNPPICTVAFNGEGCLIAAYHDLMDKPASRSPPDIPLPDDQIGSHEVLTTRNVGYPDKSGAEQEALLTVFVPFNEGERWKCGITFGPPLRGGVYYGVGEDLIEALLDGLAVARAVYERSVPEGWDSRELYGCSDFPYKVGRAFRHEPAPEIPGMPDPSAE